MTIRSIRKNNQFPGGQLHLDGLEQEDDDDGDDIVMLEKKIKSTNMPEQAMKVCMKELKRCVINIWVAIVTTFVAALKLHELGTIFL